MSSETIPESDEVEDRDSTAGEQSEPEIPEQIESIMQSGELGNMRNLCGWAVGTVVRVGDRHHFVEERFRNAWVELFNGEGRAGESAELRAGSTVEDCRSSKFGGVRFMAVTDGEYEEAYAYPDEESAQGNEPCYYVEEWDVPDQPDVGIKYPNTPGVSR